MFWVFNTGTKTQHPFLRDFANLTVLPEGRMQHRQTFSPTNSSSLRIEFLYLRIWCHGEPPYITFPLYAETPEPAIDSFCLIIFQENWPVYDSYTLSVYSPGTLNSIAERLQSNWKYITEQFTGRYILLRFQFVDPTKLQLNTYDYNADHGAHESPGFTEIISRSN